MRSEPGIPFAVEVRDLPGRGLVVVCHGELDLAAAPALQQALNEQLAREAEVLLDLAEVSFVDSSGLGALVAASQSFSASGGRLAISSRLMPQVQRLLELTGVIDVLDLVQVDDSPAVLNPPDGF